MKNKNKIYSKPFIKSLFWNQNKWHAHGVFIHSIRVAWYALRGKEYRMVSAALLHDIGKPYVAKKKGHGKEFFFLDHEECGYQIVKNWKISSYTKKIIRYHYLIRDIKNSKKRDFIRYKRKKEVWSSLSEDLQNDLKIFQVFDDKAKCL